MVVGIGAVADAAIDRIVGLIAFALIELGGVDIFLRFGDDVVIGGVMGQAERHERQAGVVVGQGGIGIAIVVDRAVGFDGAQQKLHTFRHDGVVKLCVAVAQKGGYAERRGGRIVVPGAIGLLHTLQIVQAAVDGGSGLSSRRVRGAA